MRSRWSGLLPNAEAMSIFDLFRPAKPGPLDRVSFSDQEVAHVRPDGVEEKIRWDDLHEVGILTTDEGPCQEDVFFMLLDRERSGGCSVPQSCEGIKELLHRLQQLPGFDNEAVIKAMTSTSNARFVCWKRKVG